VFAVLHIADFALHAVLRTAPGPTGQPAALFTATGQKSVVVATNPAARAAGVETGMSAPQAVARCPSLVIRAPQVSAEIEARAALFAIGFTLSPTIEDTGPGTCTLDVRGWAPAKIPAAAATAVAELGRLGLPASAGIATTPLLAWYAAKRAALPSPDSTHPGVVVVTAPASFLAPLPLASAYPGPELSAVFERWGLRTLGDLTALPRDDIVRRFGAAGLAVWTRAAGGAARPLHPVVLPRTFAATMTFDHEVETLEPLLFILRRLLDRLSLELIAAQHVAAELELALRFEDETDAAHHFRLPDPTADSEILFRTLHTRLKSLRTATGITGVDLRIVPTRPLVRQQGLFETGLRDPHGFAETLARLAALVGSDCVGTPQREDTHQPDAVRLVAPASVLPPPAEPPLHAPLGPPLRRFRPPVPAQLEFTGDRPTYLWTPEVHGEIVYQSRPWHRSGGWWQPDLTWSRIEWDIGLAPGGLYRLLRRGGSYFLEGEYD
jgi:protein ImuB